MRMPVAPAVRFAAALLSALLGVLLLSSAPSWAQPAAQREEKTPDERKASPLGVRQQQVERMMEELEAKFQNLAQTLQKTEPDRAAKLIAALQESRKLGIEQRMARIVGLLDQARLDSATQEQKLVVDDLKRLIELLLDESTDKDRALDEAERLQKWKEEIRNLIAEQQPQRRESEKLARKDETLNNLDGQIEQLKELIARQQKVIESTENARKEGVRKLAAVADQQAEVREATKKLQDAIGKNAHPQEPASPTEEKTPPGDPSSIDPKAPAQPTPGGEGEPKEGEPKGGEGAGGDKAEGASGGGQPGESSPKPSAEPPPRPPEVGESPLGRAVENQRKAEEELIEGRGKAASKAEEAALEEMKNALADLAKERARIASLPKEAFEKMADVQDRTMAKAAKLAEEMKNAPSSEGSEGGAKPGQSRVQNAQKAMQNASGDLRKEDPTEAARRQRDAIKELEQALQEIEERLSQLREETQIERLARLEARFREMLARQQKVTAETAAMQKRRAQEGGDLKRADRLALGKLGAEEVAIAEEAQKALTIIVDDGTSVVFPEIVTQLRDDLRQTGKLLTETRTDGLTIGLQEEIETTLKELIEALEKARQPKQPNQNSQQQGGGGGGPPPLLPNSAELKLLRASQLRINRRTETVGKVAGDGKSLDEAQISELKTLSERQRQIGEMTERILNRE